MRRLQPAATCGPFRTLLSMSLAARRSESDPKLTVPTRDSNATYARERPDTAVVGGGCVPNRPLAALHVFPPSFPVGAFPG